MVGGGLYVGQSALNSYCNDKKLEKEGGKHTLSFRRYRRLVDSVLHSYCMVGLWLGYTVPLVSPCSILFARNSLDRKEAKLDKRYCLLVAFFSDTQCRR
jgi:hypothetical protein